MLLSSEIKRVLIGRYKRYEEECYLHLQGYELPNYMLSHLKTL